MQFTTSLLTLALAAAGVSAAPNPAAGLTVRQVPNLVYVRFFAGGGCQEPWVEDDVFYDDGTGTCRVEPFTGTYGSFRIVNNDATRPLTLYTRTDCTTASGGNQVVIAPGQTGCFSQRIGSGSFA
ncbi:hypothetical protein BDV95DRAFT_578746 [Massariosphaeria phaeospora]|uniref:Uncharacterized protein n=1 Tax=Massariosphaeria phaeospora TaxID=100035 RepID=A0A7C8M678_9PLEO|nr:hypothetical protein BDV95DRAFT_578746 [Massariosphaeria phaeospora]